MAEKDHNRVNGGWHQEHDALSRELDAALAKYAEAEPRAGLENRVLANLRAGRAQAPDRAWWRWSVMAAVATVVVVTLALAWRYGKPSQPGIANQIPTMTQSAQEPGTRLVQDGGGERVRPQRRGPVRKTIVHRSLPRVVMAGNPKLDQFPSPQPLSEQEKILRNYVAQYPEQAVLIARARSQALRRDQLEEMKASPSGDRATDSEELNNDTTDR